MRLQEEPDLPPRINILPMIDVIFAILVFFIVSSLYLTRSEGLPVNLPSAKTAEVQKTKQITVSLDAQGKLTIDSEPAQLEQLKTEIEKLVKADTATVIINADKTVDHGTGSRRNRSPSTNTESATGDRCQAKRVVEVIFISKRGS